VTGEGAGPTRPRAAVPCRRRRNHPVHPV